MNIKETAESIGYRGLVRSSAMNPVIAEGASRTIIAAADIYHKAAAISATAV